MPRLLTIAETAEYVGVDERTVRRWIADGTLRASRIGGRLIRIKAEDVDAAFKAL